MLTRTLVAYLPLLIIFVAVMVYLYFVRRKGTAQMRAVAEVGERNTRAVEENTAAVRALIEELKTRDRS